MPDNQPTTPVQPSKTITLGANTVVQFTLKGFIGTIITILSIFVSFYFMVFEPRADKVETYQKELMMIQKTDMDTQFKTVNKGINANQQSIVNLTTRFKDLNDAVDDISNTNGGFGGSTSSVSPTVDTSLAAIHQ